MSTPTFFYDPDVADEEWGPSIVWTHRHHFEYGVNVITQHLPVDVPSKWDKLRQGHQPIWHLAQVEPLTVTPSILCHISVSYTHLTLPTNREV